MVEENVETIVEPEVKKEDIEEVKVEVPVKKVRGRKKGSKNKKK